MMGDYEIEKIKIGALENYYDHESQAVVQLVRNGLSPRARNTLGSLLTVREQLNS